MDTLVDAAEQQQTGRRSSSRMKADAPRHTLPSIEDAEVEWFARTGAFPRSTPESAPPPSLPLHHSRFDRDTRPPQTAHQGAEAHDAAMHLDSGDLIDDDELAEDVALDSINFEEEAETDSLATRPFMRARIWSSED